MRISFYTIDDLRLGYDPKGVTGWRLSQFLDWRDALEHYWSLSGAKVKEFGLSNGIPIWQVRTPSTSPRASKTMAAP